MNKFTCNKCGRDKYIGHFYYIKDGHPTRYTCKKCWNRYASKYWNKKDNWDYHVLRKYGLTKERYEQIIKDQNGVCAICEQKKDLRLSVDHCHITGKIRGLLCSNCNFGIGYLKDSPTLLQKAIDYLRRRQIKP